MFMIFKTLHENEQWNEVIELVRTEPNFRACYTRLLHSCVMHSADSVTILENKQQLKPELQAFLKQHYINFFSRSLELAHVCGFVPFCIKTIDNIPVPICLELGTFTWTAEVIDKTNTTKRQKLNAALRWKVTPVHGVYDESQILIFPYMNPTSRNIHETNFSLLNEILRKYRIIKHLHSTALNNTVWNRHKHVVLTESLDLKDQTTSGIQLLDQLRRYSLAGDTGGHRDTTMMYTRHNQSKLTSVNDAKFVWAADQFSLDDNSKAHILPPNMNVVELGSMSMAPELEFYTNLFAREVYTFFDQANVQDMSGARSASGSEQVSRQQHLKILDWCRWFQQLGQFAYSKTFKIDEKNVLFIIQPQSRLEINNVADIKPLLESQLLTSSDKSKLRNILGMTR